MTNIPLVNHCIWKQKDLESWLQEKASLDYIKVSKSGYYPSTLLLLVILHLTYKCNYSRKCMSLLEGMHDQVEF
jgi:hypothetical protein